MKVIVVAILLIGCLGYLFLDSSLDRDRKRKSFLGLMVLLIGSTGHWLAYEQFGLGLLYLIYLSIGFILLLLAISDVFTLEIPMPLILVGYFVSTSIVISRGIYQMWEQVVVAAVVLGAMLLLSKVLRGAVGEGDAHVMALIILGLGWRHGLSVFMAALVLSAVVGIGLMIFGGRGKKTAMPFVPFLAAAHFGLLFF